MIRDAVRSAIAVATLAACASIIVETRERLLVIDHAGRIMASHAAHGYAPATPTPPQPGRLRTFGRAALELADAAIGVVR